MEILSNKKNNSSLFSRFPIQFNLKKELVRQNTIHLKQLIGVFLLLTIVSNSNLFAQNASSKGLPIAYWDFEENANRTASETTVEQAINSNCVFQGKLGGNTPTICTRTGNGTAYGSNSGAAIVSGGWATSSSPVKPTNPVNPSTQTFFEFRINTTGFSGIGFSVDLYSNGTGSNYPSSAYSISTDLGLTWTNFSTDLSSRGNWVSYFFSLPSTANNISELRIIFSGYSSNNSGSCTTNGILALDNLQIFSTGTTANAGLKNSLIEPSIYTSYTSGQTGFVWIRYDNFSIESNSTFNLSSNIALGSATTAGSLNVLSGGTLDCGSSASHLIYTVDGSSSTVSINSGGTIICRSPDGISAAGTATGNIQTTTRNFNAGGNYVYKNSSSSSYSQNTGTGLPGTLTGNLTINNPSGVNLTATTNANSPSVLYLTSGNLILGVNHFKANTISGGTASSYVRTSSIGVLKQIVQTNPVTFPIGNSTFNPAIVTNSGTSDLFHLRVIDNVTDNGTGTGATTILPVIKRTWMVSEEITGGSNVNLNLSWNGVSEEINNFQASAPYIGHYITSNSQWTNIGGSLGSQNIESLGITTFSPFSIFSDNPSPLPVELLNFQANCINDSKNEVTWSTASEHNSSHFLLESSEDAMNWTNLKTIPSAGNSTSLQNYSVFDNRNVSNPIYYQLTQFDTDGKYKTYPIISNSCSNMDQQEIIVYPNPNAGVFYLKINSLLKLENAELKIIDSKGSEIMKQRIEINSGATNIYVENISLLKGIYFLKVTHENYTYPIKKISVN
jgi:hypothetical protein